MPVLDAIVRETQFDGRFPAGFRAVLTGGRRPWDLYGDRDLRHGGTLGREETLNDYRRFMVIGGRRGSGGNGNG